jgi:C4-dicarboxylate transporter DctM subunit
VTRPEPPGGRKKPDHLFEQGVQKVMGGLERLEALEAKGVEKIQDGFRSGIQTLEHVGVLFQPERIQTWFEKAEGWFLAFLFTAMATLPLIEVVLRSTVGGSIPDSSIIVQHFVLILAMAGGAVAARENRLLALSTAPALFTSRWKITAQVTSSGFAVAVTAFLAKAGVDFVLSERESGNVLSFGLPTWVVLMAIPVGFVLVAERILRKSSSQMPTRFLMLLVAGLIAALVILAPPTNELVYVAFAILFISTLFGAPIFTVLGGAALILCWGGQIPVATIPVEMYRLVVSPTLPTIPLFTLAGYFLAEGGASRRLVKVFQAWFSWLKGGPAIMTALVCAFFTSFTGASGVTILALGGLLMPVLLAEKFSEKNSLGLLTAAGSLGLLFPPSLPVILYGVVSHTPIDQMFLGGLLPGFLLVGLTAWWGISQGSTAKSVKHPLHVREALAVTWEAKWELALPVFVLVGIFGGWVTLVEAATLTALYAFVVETFVYKDLRVGRDIPKVMTECGILVGGVLLILSVAMGFTNYLVDAEVPARMVEWVRQYVHSKWVFLLLVNVVLLLVGCLMDIFSAIVVVVPILVPIAAAFGINPVHMGIIFLANMELGFLTPPLGLNLFLSSYRFKRPMVEVYRAVLPMLIILYAVVIGITYVPFLTTALPHLFGY